MADEQTLPAGERPAENGGRGEEPYLTPVQANKIASLMIHRHRRAKGWKHTKANMQFALEVTEQNMANDDGRISNGAVRNLLAMNAQNLQMDKEAWEAEHGSPEPPGGNHFHGPTQINLNNLTDEQLAELERIALLAQNPGSPLPQQSRLLPD